MKIKKSKNGPINNVLPSSDILVDSVFNHGTTNFKDSNAISPTVVPCLDTGGVKQAKKNVNNIFSKNKIKNKIKKKLFSTNNGSSMSVEEERVNVNNNNFEV
jgi:hypothetical protein